MKQFAMYLAATTLLVATMIIFLAPLPSSPGVAGARAEAVHNARNPR